MAKAAQMESNFRKDEAGKEDGTDASWKHKPFFFI